MALLEYENEMFLDLCQENGLLVTARGLGIDRILLNFIKLHCDSGNLVLVVNTTNLEEEYFIEELHKDGIKPLPKVINNEYNATERQAIYLQGGVLFVTSRILVVDMLTHKLPTNLVTGIIVYKAHKIISSCHEGFILHLYRQENKTGFIKGFSDHPQAFSAGLCRLERVMRNMFVRKLFLWPRFHASVVACMEKHKPEVIELQLSMTDSMLTVQTALLEIMSACIKEIKQLNPALDVDELTVENAIGKKSLDQVIRVLLDPIWHQLGSATKKLIGDLKLLRMMLFYLTQYDCVTFYNFLNSLRSNERAVANNSGWLFMEEANSMFVHAKERIYGKPKKDKKNDGSAKTSTDAKKQTKELALEESPKWRTLSEILDEIKDENDQTDDVGRVMVCASDDRTCAQLKEYLTDGSQALLTRLYNKTLGQDNKVTVTETAQQEKKNNKRKSPPTSKARKKLKGRSSKIDDSSDDEEGGPSNVTLTQMARKKLGISKEAEEGDDKETDGIDEALVSSQEAYYGIITRPTVVIHPLHGCKDPYSLTRTLQEVQPRYVILYDAEIQFVRQLEVFKASRPGIPLRVYFLIYSGSTEEQRYLTTLRQEKDAFEHLIKQKATMVIPEEIEGKVDTAPQLLRDASRAADTTTTVSSRRAGGQGDKETVQQKVIVDMREFRSELPSLIHRRGIDIEPITLEVGDYILTPNICVERKSISDLIGSLNSGRLYNQMLAMTRYYKRPVLLIEFDPNKSFALQTKSTLSSEISYQNLSSKLTLLTLHFPRMRVLWCPSPYATAELFEELKINRDQPDAVAAAAVTAEEGTSTAEPAAADKYNHGPHDMLLKFPGISNKNAWKIMKCIPDMAALSTTSQERLGEILEHTGNAKLLWEFLHKEQGVESDKAVKGTGKGGKFGAKGGKGKRPFKGKGAKR
ncbi:DNA repair endonuclease XPF-like [Amphiura filiformis]|uniref:DNA repair endonuclease XPF-like n=1 Tax=Amphiura filiformis TaxID=82378 RepID=UPI003B219BAE